jgi:hypothetical protein
MLSEKREEGPTRVSDGRYSRQRGGASQGFRVARATHTFEELVEVPATAEIAKKTESLGGARRWPCLRLQDQGKLEVSRLCILWDLFCYL